MYYIRLTRSSNNQVRALSSTLLSSPRSQTTKSFCHSFRVFAYILPLANRAQTHVILPLTFFFIPHSSVIAQTLPSFFLFLPLSLFLTYRDRLPLLPPLSSTCTLSTVIQYNCISIVTTVISSSTKSTFRFYASSHTVPADLMTRNRLRLVIVITIIIITYLNKNI